MDETEVGVHSVDNLCTSPECRMLLDGSVLMTEDMGTAGDSPLATIELADCDAENGQKSLADGSVKQVKETGTDTFDDQMEASALGRIATLKGEAPAQF